MPWTRPDRINATLAVIALFAAGVTAVPVGRDLWRNHNRPVAQITEPADGPSRR